MEFLTIFAKHFVEQNPCLSDIFFGLMIIAIFLGGPVVIYQLFKERLNKGRYVFQIKQILTTTQGEKADQLYMLDTMKGDLFFIDGKAYYHRVHPRDWKEKATK